jgi:ABC-type antimicrobial peptide transport system permease subunit
VKQTGSFSLWRLAREGALFHRSAHVAVFLGVVSAIGVLVGAMLVGDCVRYSLRRMALERTGRAVVAVNSRSRLFDASLADRLRREMETDVAGVLTLPCVAVFQAADGSADRQVNMARLHGVDAAYWRFGPAPSISLAEGEAAVGRDIAESLSIGVGSEIAVRVWKPSGLPRDAPLASRKDSPAVRLTARVTRILGDDELGRFNLDSGRASSQNVFVNRSWLQGRLDSGNRANLLLVGDSPRGYSPKDVERAIGRVWRMEDAGIAFRPVSRFGITVVESERVFLDDAVARAVGDMDGVTSVGTLAYLVTRMTAWSGEKALSVPYSFMVACGPDPSGRLGMVPPDMSDDEMVVNSRLAGGLRIKPGDEVTVEYFQFSGAGRFVERRRNFRVHSVVDISRFEMERALMPQFPGLSDVNDCRKWDIGMPMDSSLLDDGENRAYWEQYGPTPRAIVTLAAGQSMWGNRYGNLMSLRLAGTGLEAPLLRSRLERTVAPPELGLFAVPVREQAMRSVKESMDFGELFAGMSFFLIASALMFTGMLSVLLARQRAAEIGVLKASGFSVWKTRTLFLMEGLFVAPLGAVAGTFAGILYTKALVWVLGTHWRGAVAGTGIVYHIEPATAVKGMLIGLACSFAAIMGAVSRLTAAPARDLLAFDAGTSPSAGSSLPRPWMRPTAAGAAAAAVAIVVWARHGGSEHAASAFFGAGSLLLLAGMLLAAHLLLGIGRWRAARLSLIRLGIRNASRRLGRSLVTVGLLACGCFMVFAVSSMRDDPAQRAARLDSGSGGFELFAESTIPVADPLESEKGRKALRLDDGPASACSFVSMKVRDGDDASCFNLNRARTPRLIGADTAKLKALGAFVVEGGESPWDLLDRETSDGTVPGLAGDSTTAEWGLRMKTGPEGDTLSYTDEDGRAVNVRLVGRLPQRVSIFQGSVLVRADSLSAMFPSEEGYRMFLVDTPDGKEPRQFADVLTEKLSRTGMDVTTTVKRLRSFNLVESTYMSVFLVLGGLGLVLGTVGMGLAVFRNVLERRREAALLLCVGYSRREVWCMVAVEHLFLLLLGLLVGVVSSLVAMWPALGAPGVRMPAGTMAALFCALLVSGCVCISAAAGAALRGVTPGTLRNE